MSYYERWFEVLSTNLLRASLVSERELETGYRDPGQPLYRRARPKAWELPAAPIHGALGVAGILGRSRRAERRGLCWPVGGIH